MNAFLDQRFTRIDGGWLIRSTETHNVLLLSMGANWRIGASRIRGHVWEDLWPDSDSAWCYPRRLVPLAEILIQCLAFEPGVSEPTGWIKQAGTDRVACKALYPRPNNGHELQVPDCEYCP